MVKIRTEMCRTCGGSGARSSKGTKCDACEGKGYDNWAKVKPGKGGVGWVLA